MYVLKLCMTVQLLFFGIAVDFVGQNAMAFKITEKATVQDLKEQLMREFPSLNKMHQFAIAVNESYAIDSMHLNESDVVAIIPPVSGG